MLKIEEVVWATCLDNLEEYYEQLKLDPLQCHVNIVKQLKVVAVY